MTVVLAGIGVSPGVASGPVVAMAPPVDVPHERPAALAPDLERGRADSALEEVAQDLERRGAAVGGAAAEVLSAQAMMARDPALLDAVGVALRAGADAVDAVSTAFDGFRTALAAAGPYLAERVADLDDIRNRALAVLLGVPVPGIPDPGHPFVLAAGDLSPAETAGLDPRLVLAIVTEHGGPTSHTAIIAKSLGIPAVVSCVGLSQVADGTAVLVDGDAGTVAVAPKAAAVAHARAEQAARTAAYARYSGPGQTSDGAAVKLLVNIAGERDLAAAAAADSEGVGLFRTEFLYLDRALPPSAQEQEASYRTVFEAFAGRLVVVRTLDAGADKPLAFVDLGDEPNPALGVRGLRTSRRFPELLATQLTAISRAAEGTSADVRVMAPMVSTAAEAAAFAAQVKAAGLPSAGVMVEVPAAALRARSIADVVDFISVGTNDLTQYTFAADRMAGGLAELLDPWQPALLDLVAMTAEAGADAAIPVGVCGEAASDPALALVLVGLGVTSLSMAPVAIPALRAALAEHSLAECREMASVARNAVDGAAARRAVAELRAP